MKLNIKFTPSSIFKILNFPEKCNLTKCQLSEPPKTNEYTGV